jgi:hypothetical protein
VSDIIIQAGHVNIGQNCDWGLRGETGAPGEVEYTPRIAAIVCGALQAHGLVAQAADANANCNSQLTKRDHTAVVALHCDGRSSSGFAVGVGDPNHDGAADASEHLRQSLRSAYATATALPDIDDLGHDPNVLEYYLFNDLTPATPFALIEMGAISDANGNFGPDAQFLHDHEHEVASGIVDGILSFLGLLPDPSTVPDQGPPPSFGPNNSPVPVVVPGTPPPPAVPEVVPPVLFGPPPALVPSVEANLPAVLTNIGQAIQYVQELIGLASQDTFPTLIALSNELHTARHLLGGE